MTYQPYLPATDMERFVRELAEFVTFDDADAALVRETAPPCWRAATTSPRRSTSTS